ncbi:hypothetical protein H4R34_005180 [Dimargaris verticillata]|uniref:Uncharacterized protein n=1 Tax=Dimargaris verticillata TaxID=2761393 RepID=A0A9W8B435_9FUNG|nr:hypothetical protein H4R34_005180 [Dimargaris verticillata]
MKFAYTAVAIVLGLTIVATNPVGALPHSVLTSTSAIDSAVPGQVLERRFGFGRLLSKVFKKRPQKKVQTKGEKKDKTKGKKEGDKKPGTPTPQKPVDTDTKSDNPDSPPPQANKGSNVKGAVISGAAGTLPMAGMMMMPMGGSSGSSSPNASSATDAA